MKFNYRTLSIGAAALGLALLLAGCATISPPFNWGDLFAEPATASSFDDYVAKSDAEHRQREQADEMEELKSQVGDLEAQQEDTQSKLDDLEDK